MVDRSIEQEVWEARVPVWFSLAEEEVGRDLKGERASPEPCYLLVPRVAYLPLFYDKLEKLYARAANSAPEDELWLSSEDVPLRWHYPVGVLFDLYGRGGRMPWNITVHFKNFPEDDLLHCQGREAMESYFHSKLKEADCVKHRSEIIQSLTPQQFGQLWDSLRQFNFDDFWSINRKLMLNARSDHEPFKKIPVAIYREGQQPFQRLLAPTKDSTEQTLADLIAFYSEAREIPPEHCVMCQGVELSPSTPLQWLSEHLSYPDNFLHLCVVPRLTS